MNVTNETQYNYDLLSDELLLIGDTYQTPGDTAQYVIILVLMLVMMQVLTIGQTHFRTNVGNWQPSPAAPTFRRLDAPTILCIGRHHCIACHHPDALLGNCIAPTPLTSAHRPQI